MLFKLNMAVDMTNLNVVPMRYKIVFRVLPVLAPEIFFQIKKRVGKYYKALFCRNRVNPENVQNPGKQLIAYKK